MKKLLVAVGLSLCISTMGMKKIKFKKNILSKNIEKIPLAKYPSSYQNQQRYFSSIKNKGVPRYKSETYKTFVPIKFSSIKSKYFQPLEGLFAREYGTSAYKKNSEDKHYGKRLLDVLRQRKEEFSDLIKYYHPDTSGFYPIYANDRTGELVDARKVMNNKMSEQQYINQWEKNWDKNQNQQKSREQQRNEQSRWHREQRDRQNQYQKQQEQERQQEYERQRRQQREQQEYERNREEGARSRREREERDEEERYQRERARRQTQYTKSYNFSISINMKALLIILGAIFVGKKIMSTSDYSIVELDNKQQIIINKSFDYGYSESNRGSVVESLQKLKANQLPVDIVRAEKEIQAIMQNILKAQGITEDAIDEGVVLGLVDEMEEILKRGKFQKNKEGFQICVNSNVDVRLAQLYLKETRQLIRGEYSNIAGIAAVFNGLKSSDRRYANQFAQSFRKQPSPKSSSWGWPFSR